MASEEILTATEKKRYERNKHLIADFKKMNPEVMAKGFKPYRTLSIIAKKYKMTAAGVRFVLTKEGVINNLSELTEGEDENGEKGGNKGNKGNKENEK